MKINFDMDGTIADLYGVSNWLEDLLHEDVRPYVEARPLINLQALARVLNRLIRAGDKEKHTAKNMGVDEYYLMDKPRWL